MIKNEASSSLNFSRMEFMIELGSEAVGNNEYSETVVPIKIESGLGMTNCSRLMYFLILSSKVVKMLNLRQKPGNIYSSDENKIDVKPTGGSFKKNFMRLSGSSKFL